MQKRSIIFGYQSIRFKLRRELSFVSRTIKLGRAFGGRSLIYKALLMD